MSRLSRPIRTALGTAEPNPPAAAPAGPLTLEPGAPLFAQVRNQLRAEILDGTLRSGSQLPSESELIARFGVSRITVRRALAELQTSGLISTVSGKGSFVSRPGNARAHGPLVGVLETMRRRGHRAHGRLVSHRQVAASPEVAAALRVTPGSPLGAVTVLRYLDDQPFVIGTSWLDPSLSARVAAQDLTERDVAVIIEEVLGLRVARTRVRVEAALADAGLARRLHCERGAAILRIHSTTYGFDSQAISHAVTDCRSDRMDYRVTLHRYSQGEYGETHRTD
jgi:GntR family transcriptional regulator